MNRIFVEKKPAHRNEARHLLHDLQESLAMPDLTGLRVIQRYDIEGLTDDQFAAAVRDILSEPQVDETFAELQLGEQEIAFGVEYLPGQFDQRADSAAQCVQILTGKDRPTVSSAKVIVLQGQLAESDVARIKSYVINSVDSHEISVDGVVKRQTPEQPADVAVLAGFTQLDVDGLAELRKSLGLAMSEADIAFCQTYFRDEEARDPSITEIKMLDTYWSDHCRHTTFLTKIDQVTFGEIGTAPIQKAWETYLATREKLGRTEKPVTLMDIALMGMRELRASGELDNLEVSEEVNAASIVVPVSIDGQPEEEWLVMFKNETHNHPTEIEPFGGAATCLGGCIRDPLSGRSYVYQAMRVTGAGDPLTPFSETLPGKLPQKKICQVAASGYSSYGNQIGLATGQVAEVYHPGYVAKRLEIGAVVAAAPRSNVFRGSPAPGDVILLIGGRTGRDGVGGATGSSKEHTDTALENSAEVQKGDAPTERKIQRLFRNPELTRKIKICNDFGAGGVSVAIGEIAPSLEIDLDRVPKKYDGLDGTELAISESQERMAVCVDPSEIDFFIAEADKENLECVHVANVTDSGRLVMTWRGKTIVDLSRAFLDTNGVQQSTNIHVGDVATDSAAPTYSTLPESLAALNHCSQKGLGERFDSSVGAGTVLWPFGGEKQLTPPDAMVAKLPLLEGQSDVATFMSWGFDPYLSASSPFHGAVYAVTESVCKAVAAGARLSDVRLTLQEYFPRLGTNPARWGLPFAALLGAFHAQHELRLAAIGGKDSMSGSFNELDVPPTLVSFALAPGDAKLATSPEFKKAGSTISIVETPRDADNLPDFTALKRTAACLHQLNEDGKILSMKALGAAGIAPALAVSAFGNGIGFTGQVELPFSERYFAFLIEHSESLPAELGATAIGQTTAEPNLTLNGTTYALPDLESAWTGTLEPIYPTQPDTAPAELSTISSPSPKSSASRATKIADARPKVIIPAFPGTNSEYDSAKAFHEAGASSEILVFRNLTASHVEESIRQLAEQIRQSQILMIPGGFSAGDEPDGSGKFIATILRNPRVADAVMDLIQNRDGLVLGICNGFQALIKTGLVPYGEIRELHPDDPTLAHNDISRHISCYAYTKVVSNHSPWLTESQIGDIHRVPLSHGEGKFYASTETLSQLAANGQIATQYCDVDGTVSMLPAINPNGSFGAVEGITSPCGRVLGKMGHTERAGRLVAKNIPGNKHQPIFRSGVNYFL
ncbi:phosphoribosylformylglycinamidine synthase [Luteolibacter pohnpeiensis]|uniref:Phosphoribosylformylglycinamidine synthase n=1 Tax=Luteolibacter pohnpeiensis TaxID=454153 RepID=A0A934S1U6_9BACT|nr:phosphoribosylformylglycinamidine synthase [Luteolibacter pohnpeiensis]MBK1881665.1 phosphoribosylformylglycinamidine synthase [Luteolibacter pohnpeiensis]